MQPTLGLAANASNLSTSTRLSANESSSFVSHSDSVTVVAIVVLSTNIVASLFLNILLVLIIQYSPSLSTPPNSHLLNICVNNLLLCADMLLCVVGLRFNAADVSQGRSKFLSGCQLFLTYNSLLQYWGTFACIGYYRHKTLRKPGLILRFRRQLVSRSVIFNWAVSLLLGFMLSLTYAQSSLYAQNTFDPFLGNYFSTKSTELSNEEHVAVTFVLLAAVLVGLVIILTAYYRVCRTLNVVSTSRQNKVFPREHSPNLHYDSSDLIMSLAGSYRPQDALNLPTYFGGTLSQDHKDAFIVVFNKRRSSVHFDEYSSSDVKHNGHSSCHNDRTSEETRTSDQSTSSIRSRVTEFTDISVGADLLRFQRHHPSIIQRRQLFQRESVSLSNAIRNSLAMLVAYCICTLPLIIISIPQTMWAISATHHLQVLMFCRILFFFNALVYPLWYLLFSATVKRCFTRLWEGMLTRWTQRV